MRAWVKITGIILAVSVQAALLCSCSTEEYSQEDNSATQTVTPTPTAPPTTTTIPKQQEKKSSDIDLVIFMGEANMSGMGGDGTLAPRVSEDAGLEFRTVSDPSKLYPITEPFGNGESNPTGLNDYPGVKKGSLVSAFIDEYHKLTGRRIVAVSASMAQSDMDIWTSEGVMDDVKHRYDSAVSYLEDNGYTIGHKYVIWFQGESDGLKGSAAKSYRTGLDKVMSPLIENGIEKVFIITPGRTIDYKDIYLTIIKTEVSLCKESGYYAMATTALSNVSTEYMIDQYHYNQHVLNYLGIEAAKSVAYYSLNGVEKIVYDFADETYIVPDGVDEKSQKKEAIVYPSDIDLNGI